MNSRPPSEPLDAGASAGTGVAAITVAGAAFRPFARVLADSLSVHHPEVPLHGLWLDRRACPARERHEEGHPQPPGFRWLGLDQIEAPGMASLSFRLPIRDLASAVKPFLLSYALDRGAARAIFLDADMWVLDRLDEYFALVGGHSITLSPHRLSSHHGENEREAALQADVRLVRAGAWNGGLLGVRAGPQAGRFLAWWGERLERECRLAPEVGLHHDQRWLDLVPGMFDDVGISRDPGLNVAYWNLPERPIVRDREGERLLAGGKPLRIFHFSGFDPDRPRALSRYDQRAVPPTAVERQLCRRYAAAVRKARAAEARRPPAGAESDSLYLDAAFDNGAAIPEIARRLLAPAEETLGRDRFGDPRRAQGDGSYFSWLRGATDEGRPVISRLWRAVLEERIDVRRAFPRPFDADRTAFVDWATHHGMKEYRLASAFRP